METALRGYEPENTQQLPPNDPLAHHWFTLIDSGSPGYSISLPPKTLGERDAEHVL